MSRLVVGRKGGEALAEPARHTPAPTVEPAPKPTPELATMYWLTPAKTIGQETAEECIRKLVGRENIYAFGANTPGRKRIKPDDKIAFYANGKGVIANATVASLPELKPHKAVRHSDRYPWTFRVRDPVLYLDNPVVIDAELRSRLRAFERREPSKAWAWFVQDTREITQHDFNMLTRHGRGNE